MAPAGKLSAASALLFAAAVLLPFEAPLFRAGPLVVTSAELPIYLAIAAWLVARRRVARDLMLLSVALFVAAALLSALVAPAPALKPALRFAGGALLFLAARDLPDPRPAALAVCAGAALSALAAVLEIAVPGSAPLWTPFRAQGFTALGMARASGPFAYPTIAGMYWEASLPLAGVLLFTGARRRALAVVALAALLAAAIVLSATRAAIAGGAVAGALVLLLGWRAGARARLAGAAMLAAILVVYAAALAGGARSLLAQRMRWWRGGSWFAAEYRVDPRPLALPAGSLTQIALTVANTGSVLWPSAGDDAVHVSYHLERDDGGRWRLEDFDGPRTLLLADVAPGASVRVAALVEVPPRPGRYRLRWDLVRETVTWFSERGTAPGEQQLDVTGPPAPRPAPDRAPVAPGARRTPDRPELWRAAVALWRSHPLLGVGPDNFRHLYPRVLVVPPGEQRFADERLHANSLYLETLADLGLAGLAALALLALALARALRAHARRADLVALACAIGATTFFVHGLVDTFLTFTPTQGLFWLLLGLAAPRSPSSAAAEPRIALDDPGWRDGMERAPAST